MARIAGVDLPRNKRVDVGLTYIYGIGRTTSEKVLNSLQIDHGIRAKDLSEEQLTRLVNYIQDELVVEGQLRRQINQNISRLRDIGCYRGLRHRRGLPVRGQSTKTNARTRKGPRKTVAGKKQVGKK